MSNPAVYIGVAPGQIGGTGSPDYADPSSAAGRGFASGPGDYVVEFGAGGPPVNFWNGTGSPQSEIELANAYNVFANRMWAISPFFFVPPVPGEAGQVGGGGASTDLGISTALLTQQWPVGRTPKPASYAPPGSGGS